MKRPVDLRILHERLMDAIERIDEECDLTKRAYWTADLVIDKWWQWCERRGRTIDNSRGMILGMPIEPINCDEEDE
jgi:hypothetical protein